MFLLWLRQLPRCGDWIPASVPPRAEGRSSPTNTPVFPSSSFVLQSFVWFHIFFSAGQVLLSALSWCSVCTSVSEGVFLMYPRRKMYSMSTYSSAILFLYRVTFFKNISSCNYYAQNPKCNSPFLSEWSPVKIYMTQTPWPHWLSGLLFNASLPTSRNSTHHQLTCWPLNVTWILLLPWLAFSVPEKCREHYHYVSRLFLVQMRSCVGWSVVGSSAQQLYRNGRDCVEISPTGTCPFLTAKYSWFCSQSQPPLDY